MLPDKIKKYKHDRPEWRVMGMFGRTREGAARHRSDCAKRQSLAIIDNVFKMRALAALSAHRSRAGGVIHCQEGTMDPDRTYDRVAENHFQALLKSGRDTLEAAGDMEEAAAFLAAEGQLELAQALREFCVKHRAAEASPIITGT